MRFREKHQSPSVPRQRFVALVAAHPRRAAKARDRPRTGRTWAIPQRRQRGCGASRRSEFLARDTRFGWALAGRCRWMRMVWCVRRAAAADQAPAGWRPGPQAGAGAGARGRAGETATSDGNDHVDTCGPPDRRAASACRAPRTCQRDHLRQGHERGRRNVAADFNLRWPTLRPSATRSPCRPPPHETLTLLPRSPGSASSAGCCRLPG